jgi:hypothetical protein
MKTEQQPERISRRELIKWFATAAAASQLGGSGLWGQEMGTLPTGYGSDPKVVGIYKPGDFWPLTLNSKQRQLVTVLADLILPEDEYGPAASTLRVPDFIDEWVSAPYPKQQSSRKTILPGLKVMDELSQTRYNRDFATLSAQQGTAILDAITQQKGPEPQLKKAESFLQEFTSLCMGAYYGTPAGWKAIGYVGNTPMASFDGPPPEVMDRVGVTQTVQ